MISYIAIDVAQLTLNEDAFVLTSIGIVHNPVYQILINLHTDYSM